MSHRIERRWRFVLLCAPRIQSVIPLAKWIVWFRRLCRFTPVGILGRDGAQHIVEIAGGDGAPDADDEFFVEEGLAIPGLVKFRAVQGGRPRASHCILARCPPGFMDEPAAPRPRPHPQLPGELDSQSPIWQRPGMEVTASSFKLRGNAPEAPRRESDFLSALPSSTACWASRRIVI